MYTTNGLTVTNLTADRVPFVSTGGLIVDESNLTFTTATKVLALSGGVLQSTISKGLIVNNAGSNSTADQFKVNGNTSVVLLVTDAVNNRVGIGGNAVPTARVHHGAGSATASTAPLKFTSGPLMTIAEAGAMEFLTDDYYVTTTNSAIRRKVVGAFNAVDSLTQAAAIGATTLFTPSASGMFRISIVLQVTRAATTSSVLGGGTGVTITYTEPDGSVAQSIKPLLMDQAGVGVVPATGNILNTTATQSQGSCVIYAKTGVAIQYAIGYTSVGATTMQFSAHLKIESI